MESPDEALLFMQTLTSTGVLPILDLIESTVRLIYSFKHLQMLDASDVLSFDLLDVGCQLG